MQRDIIWNQEQTWSLDETQMEVEVILASRASEPCPPLYTLRLRYPRIIHAEVMTHRVFSRNARSSRAVPVKTMLDEVRKTPFVPWHWGKNQKGMQAGDAFPDDMVRAFKDAWVSSSWHQATVAEALMNQGIHKQIPNRLLEPFIWIDVLVTSTAWLNFLWLRNHEAAEPHLRDLARLVEAAHEGTDVQALEPGEWHLPYITEDDRAYARQLHGHPSLGFATEAEKAFLCKISAARCARISYRPFDGDASYARELERYHSLVSSDRVHASPLEHQAMPDTHDAHWGWDSPHLHGNLHGWRQWRKSVPGENHATA